MNRPGNDAKRMLSLLIRDDDICHATPTWMLKLIREQVWKDRPVNFSVIPFTHPGEFLKSPGAWATKEPAFAWHNQVLADYLEDLDNAGLLGLAMHGWTHHSPRSANVPHEFSAANAALLERVLSGFDWFESTVGYKVFVPPHNEVHPTTEHQLLAHGVSVCRSLRDDEVAALGETLGMPVTRASAKRMLCRPPRQWPFTLHQTLIINKQRLWANACEPETACAEMVAACAEHGMGVITFHWWDFFLPDARPDRRFIRWVQRFFAILEDSVTVSYLHFGQLAGALQPDVKGKNNDTATDSGKAFTDC